MDPGVDRHLDTFHFPGFGNRGFPDPAITGTGSTNIYQQVIVKVTWVPGCHATSWDPKPM